MKVSFLLLTWNRHKFLEICLERLIESIADPNQCEILVLNNGSTDATSEVLRRYSHHKQLRVLTLPKHKGLQAYKKLFSAARGELMVTIDDDVLAFPASIDRIFQTYMRTYTDFGYLALNVVQNEFTNGAKPGPELYTDDLREGLAVQLGPAGGWCACFRRRDYRKVRFVLYFRRLNMSRSEDAVLINLMKRLLSLKAGIIRDAVCLHASGPHYARLYGHLDREMAKYAASGLTDFVELYRTYMPNEASVPGDAGVPSAASVPSAANETAATEKIQG
jgi:glycosyltransferase involved in cell wall biosynthesis